MRDVLEPYLRPRRGRRFAAYADNKTVVDECSAKAAITDVTAAEPHPDAPPRQQGRALAWPNHLLTARVAGILLERGA